MDYWDGVAKNGFGSEESSEKSDTRVAETRSESQNREIPMITWGGDLSFSTIMKFSAPIEANATEFDASEYAAEFDRLIELSSEYSGSAITIQCHTDTHSVVAAVLGAGLNLPDDHPKKITSSGGPREWVYNVGDEDLDLLDSDAIMQMVYDPDFNQPHPHRRSPAELAAAAGELGGGRVEFAVVMLKTQTGNGSPQI